MRTRYVDAQNLATFFALFSGFSQVASLLTRVFVSGRLLSRFGVRTGLTVLPAAHVACTALIVASGTAARRGGPRLLARDLEPGHLQDPEAPDRQPVVQGPLPAAAQGPAPGHADHGGDAGHAADHRPGRRADAALQRGRAVRPGRVRLADAGRLRRLGGDGQGRRSRIRGAPSCARSSAVSSTTTSPSATTTRAAWPCCARRWRTGSARRRPLRARAAREGAGPRTSRRPSSAWSIIRAPTCGARRAPPPGTARTRRPPSNGSARTRRATRCRPCAPWPLRAACRPGRAGDAARWPWPRSTTRAARSAAARWSASLRAGHEAAPRSPGHARDLAAFPRTGPGPRAWPERRGRRSRPPSSRRCSPIRARPCGAPPSPPPGVRATRASWPAVAEALGDRRLRGAPPPPLSCSAGRRCRGRRSRPVSDGIAAGPVAREAARVLGRVGGARAEARPAVAPRLSRPARAHRGARVARAQHATRPHPASEEAGRASARQLEAGARGRGLDPGRPARPRRRSRGSSVLRAALARELARSRQAVLLLLSFLHDPVAILRAREGLAHGVEGEARLRAGGPGRHGRGRPQAARARAARGSGRGAGRGLRRASAAGNEAGGGAGEGGRTAAPGAASPRGRPRARCTAATHLAGEGWEDVLDAAAADASAARAGDGRLGARASGQGTKTREEAGGC